MHHHVPLAGGFLCRRNAPCRADGFHLGGLLFLSTQFFQAEIECPADLLCVAAAYFTAQFVHSRHKQLAGLFGIVQCFPVFLRQFVLAEALGAFLKFCAPRRRVGRPGVGVVFQRADLLLFQIAQAGLGEDSEVFGEVGTAQQSQQCPHRRGRGTELRRGGLVAVERDVCHAEFVPDGGAVLRDIAADHGDPAAAHALPHQTADGGGGAAGFFFPAGGGKQTHLRGCRQGFAAAGLQKLGHGGKAGGVFVAQVAPQQLRRGHLGAAFSGQLPQLCGHLLGTGEQPHIPGHHGRTVVAQGHRHGGQGCQHRTHQPLFGGIEGVEFVNEHLPPLQELRQFTPGKSCFQPVGGQFQTVGRVHAGARQQRFISLKDHGQLAQLRALRAAVLGQRVELLAGKARAFQLVDGLSGHLAEGRAAAVAVVIMHVVLQFFQRAAHQHGPARVRKGLHRRAALGREDVLGKAREGKALHHAGKGIAQFAVDAALGARRELLRHQQDAAQALFGPGADAGIQQGRFAAAGTA